MWPLKPSKASQVSKGKKVAVADIEFKKIVRKREKKALKLHPRDSFKVSVVKINNLSKYGLSDLSTTYDSKVRKQLAKIYTDVPAYY